jgi:hypothetical protein
MFSEANDSRIRMACPLRSIDQVNVLEGKFFFLGHILNFLFQIFKTRNFVRQLLILVEPLSNEVGMKVLPYYCDSNSENHKKDVKNTASPFDQKHEHIVGWETKD